MSRKREGILCPHHADREAEMGNHSLFQRMTNKLFDGTQFSCQDQKTLIFQKAGARGHSEIFLIHYYG